MQVAISRFFIREMRFAKSVFILLFAMAALSAKADVGQTHQLKQKRIELLHQVEALGKDTSAWHNQLAIDSLQKRIILLDAQIMKSYDETITRLAEQKISHGTNSRYVVLLALLTSLATIFLAMLILVARKRILARGYRGWLDIYKQMTADLVKEVSFEKASDNRLLRVNVVVIVGLLMMSVSVVAFLLRTL